MADLKLVLHINADGTATIKTLNQVGQAADQVGKQSKTAGDTATRSFAATAQGAISLQGEVDRIRSGVIKLAVAAGAVNLARSFTAEVIDASNKLQGWRQGLEAATRSAAQGAEELAFVRAESQRLGTALVENASSYTKLTASARGTNLEGENTRKIFSAVSEAGRVLNLSSEQVGGALTAIEQMMSKGNVQAEELRGQLGERLPGAFGIAAEAMGVTTQQLNKMLENGEVLAEDLLPKLADRLHALYGAAAVSAANAPAAEFERLRNALFELYAAVGDAGFMAALASGSRTLAEALTALVESGALDKIATGIALIGVASLASFGGSTLTAIQTYVAGLGTAVAAQSAAIEMEQLAAAAAAKTAAAKSVDIARTLEVIQLARAEVVAKAAVAQSDIILAQKHLAAANAAGAQSFALREQRIATEQLIAAQTRHAALLTELAVLGRAQAGVQTSLSAAASEQVAAQTRVTASVAATGGAMTALRGVGSGLLSLLGGWPGVALLAVGSLVYLATRSTETSKEVDRLAASTQTLEARTLSLTDALQLLATGVEPPEKSLLELKEAQLASAQAQLDASSAYMKGTPAIAAVARSVRNLRTEVDELREAQAGLGVANLKAAWSDNFREGVTVIRGAINAAINWRDTLKTSVAAGSAALDEQAGKLEKNAREMGKSKAQIWEMAAAEELLAQATKLSAVEGSEAYRLLSYEIDKKYARVIAAATADDAATAAAKRQTNAIHEVADASADYIASLEAQVAAFGLTDSALERYKLSQQTLTPELRARGEAAIAANEQLRIEADLAQNAADALATLRGMQTSSADEVADLRAKLGGASAAQIAFNKTQRDAAAAYLIAAAAMDPSALDAYVKTIDAAQEKLNLTEELDASAASAAELKDIFSDLGEKSGFDSLVENIQRVEDAILAACDVETVKKLQAELDKLRTKSVRANTTAFLELGQTIVGSMKESAQEGSRQYAALEVAQAALALGLGINAILAQGAAPPPVSFAAMAAMAATVIPLAAQLGASISNYGSSGFNDTAGQRQASQGTGTVLGDADAKSESIQNALEITADATSELVGINRGMLRALIALQSGLGSAANLLAHGAGEADFSGMNLSAEGERNIFEQNDALGRLIGGSSKITDQGIIIFGGALNDLLENVAVGAYQEVQSRTWAFGSTHTREGIVDVSDQFGQQFQLVIGSIVDTVREGALAIGMLPADIQAALDAYAVEEIRISLKGLSAEEQEAELTAVLSAMFDGVAGAVVPFIGRFQRTGEGLGETLVRVATEVQVFREGIRQLGLSLNADKLGPELFAQISDAMITAAGGIEAFISGMQSFVDNFATDAFKFTSDSDALNSAFSQVGLTVPATSDGMWDLMKSLDATTAEGREQIATLLRLSGVAKEYYDALDAQIEKATEVLDRLGLAGNGLSDFGRELADITTSGAQAVDAANTLAIAQGRTGASSIQLAKIHQWTASQIAQAIKKLVEQTQDLIANLYGGIPGTLEGINAQISELEGSMGSGIAEVAEAGEDLFAAWLSGIQSINDYLDSMLLGDLSALAPEDQLAEAQRQLIEAQQQAVAGDIDALNSLPALAQQYLESLQGSGASGGDYNAGFDWVRQLLQSVRDMQNPHSQSSQPAPVELVPSQELLDLYAARDVAEAAANAAQRAEWAQQLIQNLSDMATIFQVPVLDLIEAQGLSLAALATDLGVDLDNLNAASVQALGSMAVTLGLSLSDLTGALGINLIDLRGGLTEITDRMGIDLGALTVETTQTLAALAASMGTNLFDLSEALGIDLGSLTDATSLINQGLGTEISALPKDQRDQLEPLFNAIAKATTEADANTAIAALETAVNDIGGDTANLLAPYLAGVMPVKALDQLDFLQQIHDVAKLQLDTLGLIRDNLKASNAASGVPSYAVGTGYVPRDGLAMIHEGEAIIPAPFASWMRSNGMPVARGGGNDERVVVELRSIRERLESLERSNNAGHGKTASTVETGDKSSRAQREELSRRNQDAGRSRTG